MRTTNGPNCNKLIMVELLPTDNVSIHIIIPGIITGG